MSELKEKFELRQKQPLKRFPKWLHIPVDTKETRQVTHHNVRDKRLYTVCEEARCPNLTKCFAKKTATYLTLGKECTRQCGFCSIDHSKKPSLPEEDEGFRIVESAKALNLKHIVLTMVARDDLACSGGTYLRRIIDIIKSEMPHATIEVLTSDFNGNRDSIALMMSSGIRVFNHNIETIKRLTPRVRHKATYQQTLDVLKMAHDMQPNNKIMIKSGIMVGLGETDDEVFETIDDLHRVGCSIVTIGQYLQATKRHLRVKRFVSPEQFQTYEEYGKKNRY